MRDRLSHQLPLESGARRNVLTSRLEPFLV